MNSPATSCIDLPSRVRGCICSPEVSGCMTASSIRCWMSSRFMMPLPFLRGTDSPFAPRSEPLQTMESCRPTREALPYALRVQSHAHRVSRQDQSQDGHAYPKCTFQTWSAPRYGSAPRALQEHHLRNHGD